MIKYIYDKKKVYSEPPTNKGAYITVLDKCDSYELVEVYNTLGQHYFLVKSKIDFLELVYFYDVKNAKEYFNTCKNEI